MTLQPIAAYAPGVPREVEIPDTNLVQMFRETVARFTDRPALDFFGATTTYGELGESVSRAAAVLEAHGVRKGDRVAVVLPTCPQTVVAFYAALTLGAIVVEHNPLSTRAEFERTFRDHGARVAVVWDKKAAMITSLELEHSVQVLSVDMSLELPRMKRLALRLPLAKARLARDELTAGRHVDGCVSFDREAGVHPPHTGACPSGPRDVALLQYTGGTTGDPKAAMLTHRNLMANVAQSMAWVPDLRPGSEVFYGILPLFHAYGMMLCLLDAVRLGACLVLFPRFDEGAVIAAMKRRPATFLPGVPPIYARLADAADEGRVDLSHVRSGFSGAMPLDAALVERWERITGGMLIEGYGMTETSPIAIANPLSAEHRAGCVGVAFPSTEVRIADLESGDVITDAAIEGELQIRGPQVFSGYWNKPEAKDALFTDDGWLRTGDIAIQDDDGFVTIVDRIKDLIITGGFNVYPSEVEDALRLHDSIDEVAVVGKRLDGGDERVTAYVTLHEGKQLVESDLEAHARRHLAGYKVPREYIAVDEIPVSAIGKVVRRALRGNQA